ncbi:PREDICTED: uncharacterized protein LOC106751481, partial [Dinoponera quadriceps]|uniref:Uncharacterized protein LOC106751481 n=1 Tax=Dinoponera quadriceps TaxID=609295 RepID=A0A6P3YA74_DINQU
MFGGECTYDVSMVTLSNATQTSHDFCSSIKSELKCRPKGQDSLSCHFQNSQIWPLHPEKKNCIYVMDMIRAIVNQLNIGFEVLERRDQFTIMENSTEDYCEVDVTFVHDSSEEDDDDDRDEHHDNED